VKKEVASYFERVGKSPRWRRENKGGGRSKREKKGGPTVAETLENHFATKKRGGLKGGWGQKGGEKKSEDWR